MKKIIIIITVIILGLGAYFGTKYLNQGTSSTTSNYEDDELFSKYYKDASKTLEKLSLAEKIGQLFLVRYDKNLAEDYINDYYAGGFILFAKDFQNQDKESIKKELDNLKELSNTPLMIAVDEEGGYVTRVSRYKAFREEKFKSPREYYEEGGEELLAKTEEEKANLLLSIGVNTNLAPVSDVSTSEDDFINNRTFNRDAKETSELVGKMVSYANKAGIASCLKHFPGYGNNVDTHTGVAIDERSYENFVENDYLPFESGIKNKVPMVLVSHNVVKAIDSKYPASLSLAVHKELRDKLDFSGIIITDDLAMDAVESYVEDGKAAVLAINALNDMIITSDYKSMYNEVYDAVLDGTIKEEVIDKAVLRILAFKMAYKM